MYKSGDIIDVTGIDENSISNVNIFPNPSNGNITISSENKIEQITVFNSIGEEVKATITASNDSFTILNEPFITGIYHLEILFNDGSKMIRKFVLK